RPSCISRILFPSYWSRRGMSRRREFLEQRLGLLQIHRIKPLGEPAVNLRQHLLGFAFLTLLLPQAREAHCCSLFWRLRLLLASICDALPKPPPRLFLRRDGFKPRPYSPL